MSLDIISKQFCDISPRDIRQKESQHGLVWTSVNHHLRLMRDKEVVVRHIALLSLANLSFSGKPRTWAALTFSDYNRSLMIEEDIVDDIACMQWVNDGDFEGRKESLLNIIFQNFGQRPVPTLFHMCVNHIYRNAPHLIPTVTAIRNWVSCIFIITNLFDVNKKFVRNVVFIRHGKSKKWAKNHVQCTSSPSFSSECCSLLCVFKRDAARHHTTHERWDPGLVSPDDRRFQNMCPKVLTRSEEQDYFTDAEPAILPQTDDQKQNYLASAVTAMGKLGRSLSSSITYLTTNNLGLYQAFCLTLTVFHRFRCLWYPLRCDCSCSVVVGESEGPKLRVFAGKLPFTFLVLLSSLLQVMFCQAVLFPSLSASSLFLFYDPLLIILDTVRRVCDWVYEPTTSGVSFGPSRDCSPRGFVCIATTVFVPSSTNRYCY